MVDALYSGPNVKKIPYIRSLGVRGKRKVLETVFLQDNHPSKKKKLMWVPQSVQIQTMVSDRPNIPVLDMVQITQVVIMKIILRVSKQP